MLFTHFLRPKSLSQKMMRVIFSIYLVVTCLITCLQFLSEYLKTQDSIVKELKQLEVTVNRPIATSLWQYNRNQMNVLIAGLIKMPIIVGVDIQDKSTEDLISERSYTPESQPLSIFSTQSDLYWTLNERQIFLGSLTLYSSSQVVLDRVLFGFALIAITAIIKLSILFWLFVWAFDRYMGSPIKELMLQVNDVQKSHNLDNVINLSNTDDNELRALEKHINKMLSSLKNNQNELIENEQEKRKWLEEAVEKRTHALQVSNNKLKELATRDSLTGILNRGSFFDTAQQLLALSQRQKSKASFVLMDLDHFKVINDTFGHHTGDQVLIHFTQTIRDLLRKSDLVGRVGGEEFAVFLPDTGAEEAYKIADKIRHATSHSTLQIDDEKINFTVSLGIETSTPDDNTIDELFKRADMKLYGAKGKGRDRIEY